MLIIISGRNTEERRGADRDGETEKEQKKCVEKSQRPLIGCLWAFECLHGVFSEMFYIKYRKRKHITKNTFKSNKIQREKKQKMNLNPCLWDL